MYDGGITLIVAALGIRDVVANRIFYAAFHTVSALLINDHIEVRSHKGAGLMFGQKYVIPGIFSADDGRLYAKLQDLREKSDYNLVYQSSEDEMAPHIEKTRVRVIFFYLNRRGANRRRYWRQLHQRWPREDSWYS